MFNTFVPRYTPKWPVMVYKIGLSIALLSILYLVYLMFVDDRGPILLEGVVFLGSFGAAQIIFSVALMIENTHRRRHGEQVMTFSRRGLYLYKSLGWSHVINGIGLVAGVYCLYAAFCLLQTHLGHDMAVWPFESASSAHGL
jgi:hypothetical protein